MTKYRITGNGDGVDYGIYEGATPRQAVEALLHEAACDDPPNMDAWYVTEVGPEETETK